MANTNSKREPEMFNQDTHKSKLKTLKILMFSVTQMHPVAFLPHKGSQSHMGTLRRQPTRLLIYTEVL